MLRNSIIGGWTEKTAIENEAQLSIHGLPEDLQAKCLQPGSPRSDGKIAKVKVNCNSKTPITRYYHDQRKKHGDAATCNTTWCVVERSCRPSKARGQLRRRLRQQSVSSPTSRMSRSARQARSGKTSWRPPRTITN